MSLYTELCREAAAIADLDAALGLLAWDQEVNMPPGAAQRRASQLGTLAGMRHQRALQQLYPLAERLVADASLTANELQNVVQLKRTLDKVLRLPEAFVARLTQLASQAQQAWQAARSANDFKLFEPLLTQMVVLKRQEADFYTYTTSPYDALLDSYDAGLTTAQVATLFANLTPQLKRLVQLAQARQAPAPTWLQQPVAAQAQLHFTHKLVAQLGYNFKHGRQDVSAHPFSSGFGPEDVRITTHVQEDDSTQALFSSIHECGHALYEQGLNPAYYGMPQGEACSLSIHESQSRLWENEVARGLPFWQYAFNSFAALFPDKLQGRTALDVYQAVNYVQPSLIRIHADELTYHFHIMLRFDLERELVEGQLAVKDLPERWDAAMQYYLGLTVPSQAQGVLQDIHWSHGSFGYFPTYTLGSLYAAQFYYTAFQQTPGLEGQLAAGNFASLHQWLAQHIYSQGRLTTSGQLCQQATGQPLSADYFLRHIEAKITAL